MLFRRFAARIRQNEHALGIVYIVASAFCFSLMSFFIRRAGDLPTMQKAFFRNFVALIVATVMLLRTPEKFHMQKGSAPGLFMRSFFGSCGLIANFYAIDRLGLADANVLNKMAPFFAILASAFILNEKPNRIEIFSVIVAFAGALFVVKPTAGLASLPALVGLFGGFGAGTAYTFVRKLGMRGERGPMIVFCFSAFSVLMCTPMIVFRYVPMTPGQLGYLLIGGVAAAGGQLTVTAAYTHAPAREISVFDYAQVLFAALWGWLFFGEVSDGTSLIGYVLIIGTAVAKWFATVHLAPRKKVQQKTA
jgi:drug/metabolite transporter (DMT)-like permease